jgi:hypothetical protein
MFVLTLKEHALECFHARGSKKITLFVGLIKAFRECWDPSYGK